jgi:hypothetical protein
MIGAAQFTLPINEPACPDDWEQATIPARTVIIGEVNGRILWGGIIWQRNRSDADVIELQCSTVESFYSRRYVDETMGPYLNVSEIQIAQNLIFHGNLVRGYGIDPTWQIYETDFTNGVHRDRTEYARYADQKLFDMIQNLANLDDGFEWYIDLRWHPTDTPKRLSYVVKLAKQLGNVTSTPEWVFEYPGNIVSWNIDEDYTEDAYANEVVAGGEGEEEARIMSVPGIARDTEAINDFGNPMIEYRVQTQLTTQTNVNAAAMGALERMKRGARAITLTAIDSDFIETGLIKRGDTCIVDITGGGYPNGYTGLHRVIGWTLDPSQGTISPQLNPYGE